MPLPAMLRSSNVLFCTCWAKMAELGQLRIVPLRIVQACRLGEKGPSLMALNVPGDPLRVKPLRSIVTLSAWTVMPSPDEPVRFFVRKYEPA